MMTLDMSSAGKAEIARVEPMAYLSCVLFTLSCQQCQVLAVQTYDPYSKSTLARTMNATTWNSGNLSHSSANTPRLAGLMTCQFTASIGLSIFFFSQIGVQSSQYWQSDIFAR